MKTSNPEVKALMMDVLTFTDGMDEKGARERRTTVYKGVYGGFQELKKQLIDGMEVATISSDIKLLAGMTPPEIKWSSLKDYKHDADTKVVGERHTDAEIELSDKALAALRYYAKQRDELPEISADAYVQFEAIIAEKH